MAHQPGCDALPLERGLGPDPRNSDDDVLPPIADDVLEDANVRLVPASQRNVVGPGRVLNERTNVSRNKVLRSQPPIPMKN